VRSKCEESGRSSVGQRRCAALMSMTPSNPTGARFRQRQLRNRVSCLLTIVATRVTVGVIDRARLKERGGCENRCTWISTPRTAATAVESLSASGGPRHRRRHWAARFESNSDAEMPSSITQGLLHTRNADNQLRVELAALKDG
jgi:hypothetical protein